MIEVEKKFLLSDEERERLLEGAELESERTFTDTYYDTSDYALTTKDTWFRFRDGKCELKVPRKMDDYDERAIDQYDELLTEQEIRQYLSLPAHKTFKEDLEYSGYRSIGTITTHRKAWRKEGFGIDIDYTDTGYSVGEIELLVEDSEGLEEASRKIVVFAQKHQLTLTPVRGKFAEHIRVHNPEHFQLLIDVGVFPASLKD
ncbi:MAG: CYTH domain-containing protein [Patescibacteria group bacterium]